MQFVQKLNYRPKGLETIKLELNYRMIFRLKDTLNFFKTPYDSNIYQGFNCEWQDVFEEWTFKNDILEKAENRLAELLSQKSLIKCFCLYGGAFSGKSTE